MLPGPTNAPVVPVPEQGAREITLGGGSLRHLRYQGPRHQATHTEPYIPYSLALAAAAAADASFTFTRPHSLRTIVTPLLSSTCRFYQHFNSLRMG